MKCKKKKKKKQLGGSLVWKLSSYSPTNWKKGDIFFDDYRSNGWLPGL